MELTKPKRVVALVAAGMLVIIGLGLALSDGDDAAVNAGAPRVPATGTPTNGGAEQSAGPDFADDLAISKKITGVSTGDPCESADPSWLQDEGIQPPPLAPVESAGADGECVVGGWSYLDVHKPLPFERPTEANGYVRQPIFDESGRVIRYFTAGAADGG